ncbi:MAG TPA: hypothetical protein VGW35_17815 [Methylomirabilota bacterium]|nr:hypothetical protein [Methylomirabilota bacterium]
MTPDPSRELAGHLSVEASARRVRQYRYAEERMVRILAGWIALTPEVPVKLLMGRQVWDCAQHADLWGKRLPELRAPAQVSEPASQGLVGFMAALESREAWGETLERLTGIYRVLKPHLAATYAAHLARANPVFEAPTRRILERCLDEERRHLAEGRHALAVLARSEAARTRVARWEAELRGLLGSAGGVTGEDGTVPAEPEDREDPGAPAAADDAGARPRAEPEPGRDRAHAEPVARALEHARRLVSGDPGALDDLDPGARLEPADLFRQLLGEAFHGFDLVAHARIGRHHILKTRYVGHRTVVVQARWAETPEGGWRILAAEQVRVAGPEGA